MSGGCTEDCNFLCIWYKKVGCTGQESRVYNQMERWAVCAVKGGQVFIFILVYNRGGGVN